MSRPPLPPLPPPPFPASDSELLLRSRCGQQRRRCRKPQLAICGPRRQRQTVKYEIALSRWRSPLGQSLLFTYLTSTQWHHWCSLFDCKYCWAGPGEICLKTSRCGQRSPVDPGYGVHGFRGNAGRRAANVIPDDVLRKTVPSWVFWARRGQGIDPHGVEAWAKLAGVTFIPMPDYGSAPCSM